MVEFKLLIVSFIALYSFAQIIECLPVRKKNICHFLPQNEKLLFSNFKRRNHPRSKNYRHIPFYINKELSYDEPTNLIIHTHYDKSFYDFPSNILKLYKNYLIPEAIKYWENSLKVKYRYFPILLGRSCVNLQLIFDDSTKSVACETDCSEKTKCGDHITIPEEHLDTCKYCVNNKSCTNRGKQNRGIKADFILYISAIDSKHCNASNTVAFASYCQLESKYNRPVAGYVNICPHSVSNKKSDIDPALATLKHEILHALGFSAGLFGFFLDASGNPLTERNPSTGKPPFNTKTNMYEASNRVVRNVKRSNWKIGNKNITRNIKMLITPKVLAEVRNHFNCSTLEGAELEDQGDIGTRLTHWEKRVFENEAMTGTYTQNSVFSKITFAFLEDTGWYIANYSMAEKLTWGSNLGCDFVKKSCKSWMDSRREKNLSIRPFCDYIPANENVNTKYECNEQRDAVLLCNMVEYSHEIPNIYRNFDSYYHQNHSHAKHWLPRYSYSHLGGSVALADYCPFMQQVSWSMNNQIRDSKCIYEENSPDQSKNYILENYGSKSKCFSHSKSWLIYTNECKSRITVSKTIGCYQYECDPNDGLVVLVAEQRLICQQQGDILNFSLAWNNQNDFNLYYGNLICPACEDICQDKKICDSVRKINSTNRNKTQKEMLFRLNGEEIGLNEQKNQCFRLYSHMTSSVNSLVHFCYIRFSLNWLIYFSNNKNLF